MTKQLTVFGLAVKKKLLDLNVSQKEFCQRYGIPMNRLSEIIYGDRIAIKYKKEVAKVLRINISA
ncbi:MAG: Rha family transcriptional regulator [Clostridia bacterium]|nr:Rha family transcriptional regulator [Clostridia bacterium]MDD4049300.1 Rha family transcriptional regulator [Clostridia bacterium]